jgi:hypothetical protein
MTESEAETRQLYSLLQPGDRVSVEHEVKVGLKVWKCRSEGTVIKKERRRHGLHHARSADDKVYSDVLVLRRHDGELTTASIDEYTVLSRVE